MKRENISSRLAARCWRPVKAAEKITLLRELWPRLRRSVDGWSACLFFGQASIHTLFSRVWLQRLAISVL